MRSVAYVTVGCKLNQFETEQMREAALASGHPVVPSCDRADVYVINTCTVTSKSDYRSRQAIRRARRLNPDALVIATGCYAQREPHAVAGLDVDVVLGNRDKEDIAAYLTLDRQEVPVVSVSPVDKAGAFRKRPELRGFGRYTRAFVKIQDGCDNHCSYCAVPLARGRGRSKPPAEVIREIEVLTGEGFREIVLTGVHLGSYGRDLRPPVDLPMLLRAITGAGGPERIRLSSIEPADFSAELVDTLTDPAIRLCPHVHIPLQSGDDAILKAMGRPYTRGDYAALVRTIARRVPACGIGADVMVGFPGEDARAFANTYELLAALPVSYLHVFAFSERYGTPAAGMDGKVAAETKKGRSRLLRELGQRKSHEFRTSLVGSDLATLVLGTKTDCGPTGLSGNYVRVFFDQDLRPNSMVSAHVTGVRRDGVWGSVRP